MGWFSHKRSHIEVRPEQKWDYIQLNDFKADGFFTYIAYGYLFVSLFISIAVYAVDTFTAINLLVFNKWSSEIQPAISFDVTKWIFSICIILSFVNLGYEHLRAQIIIRRGSVAESFLDNLAVRLQSVRLGNKGWRRFLVFAELTKSKKGAEYIALFTYFSFQAWIRIIFCSGPRQVVNAVTLYSVYQAKLQVDGDNFESSLESLFAKIKTLAEQDYQQALILSGMLFTLVIWVFSALSFILAVMFFVFFLWGWIPKQDGGLSGYCERKVTKRLMQIVSTKVDAAIADQERQRKKAELRAAKKTGILPPEERQATLPTLMPEGDDKLPNMPMLNRNDTMATLPPYTSRPTTPSQSRGFELNQMRPAMPSRNDTASSRAPLLNSGADMGMASPAMPSPNYPMRSATAPNQLMRTGTSSSINSRMGPPTLARVQTNNSIQSAPAFTQGPTTYSPETEFHPMPQPIRSPTGSSIGSHGMPPRSTPAPRGTYDDYGNRSASPAPLRQMPSNSQFSDYSNGRASPAPSARQMGPRPTYDEYSRPMGPPQGQGQGGNFGPRPAPGPGYLNRSQTAGPMPYHGSPGPGTQQPQRNMTAPISQQGYQQQGYQQYQGPQTGFHGRMPSDGYPQRPGTAQSQRSQASRAPMSPQHSHYSSGMYSDLESQRGTPGPRY